MRNISNKEVRDISLGIRKLYRADLTDEEAQDGWVKLSVALLRTDDECSMIHATSYEFAWRMQMMGMDYINVGKLTKALDEFDEVSE